MAAQPQGAMRSAACDQIPKSPYFARDVPVRAQAEVVCSVTNQAASLRGQIFIHLEASRRDHMLDAGPLDCASQSALYVF